MAQPPNYYGNSYPTDMGPMGGQGPQAYPNPYVGGDKMNNQNFQQAPSPMKEPEGSCTDENSFSGLCKKNIGKPCAVFCSFTDSSEWHDMIFKGTLENFGQDHVNIYNKAENKYTVIIAVYIDYIEFYEKLEY